MLALNICTVIAIDNSLERLNCARANAEIYGVEEYITFIHADYLEWAREQAELPEGSHDKEDIDVIFMSPPWGGISYQEDTPHTLEQDPDPDQTISLPNPGDTSIISKSVYASYPLSRLLPKNGRELFNLSRQLTKNIAFYLPRNMDIHEAAALGDKDETVEVEEEWMGSKLKALTFYYGDLAKQM